MRDPVVNEQRDSRVVYEIQSFLRRGICSHDDDGVGVERRRGKVCVVHKGNVREHCIACCEV